MYKQCKNIDGTINDKVICRVADNAFIPFDEANTDYQAYLAWVAEGNQAIPAESEPLPAITEGNNNSTVLNMDE